MPPLRIVLLFIVLCKFTWVSGGPMAGHHGGNKDILPQHADQQSALNRLRSQLHSVVDSFYNYFSYFQMRPGVVNKNFDIEVRRNLHRAEEEADKDEGDEPVHRMHVELQKQEEASSADTAEFRIGPADVSDKEEEAAEEEFEVQNRINAADAERSLESSQKVEQSSAEHLTEKSNLHTVAETTVTEGHKGSEEIQGRKNLDTTEVPQNLHTHQVTTRASFSTGAEVHETKFRSGLVQEKSSEVSGTTHDLTLRTNITPEMKVTSSGSSVATSTEVSPAAAAEVHDVVHRSGLSQTTKEASGEVGATEKNGRRSLGEEMEAEASESVAARSGLELEGEKTEEVQERINLEGEAAQPAVAEEAEDIEERKNIQVHEDSKHQHATSSEEDDETKMLKKTIKTMVEELKKKNKPSGKKMLVEINLDSAENPVQVLNHKSTKDEASPSLRMLHEENKGGSADEDKNLDQLITDEMVLRSGLEKFRDQPEQFEESEGERSASNEVALRMQPVGNEEASVVEESIAPRMLSAEVEEAPQEQEALEVANRMETEEEAIEEAVPNSRMLQAEQEQAEQVAEDPVERIEVKPVEAEIAEAEKVEPRINTKEEKASSSEASLVVATPAQRRMLGNLPDPALLLTQGGPGAGSPIALLQITGLKDEYSPVAKIEIEEAGAAKPRVLTQEERSLVQQLVRLILQINKSRNTVTTRHRYEQHLPDVSLRVGPQAGIPWALKPVDVERV